MGNGHDITAPAARTEEQIRNEPDPLYDPALLIFVYAAWAGATAFVNERFGLLTLVLGAVVHTAAALRRSREPEERPFVHDFAAILLFCSAAIAAAVLVLT